MTTPNTTEGGKALSPCPFCGKRPPADLIDSLYPSGTCWRETDGMRHYVNYRDKQPGDHDCWEMNCTQSIGGCGAEIRGDSKDETIAAWNRRPVLATQAPAGAMPKLPPLEFEAWWAMHKSAAANRGPGDEWFELADADKDQYRDAFDHGAQRRAAVGAVPGEWLEKAKSMMHDVVTACVVQTVYPDGKNLAAFEAAEAALLSHVSQRIASEGEARPVLEQVSNLLRTMIASAVELHDGIGDIVGYHIKTGALHRIVGVLASTPWPVSFPSVMRSSLALPGFDAATTKPATEPVTAPGQASGPVGHVNMQGKSGAGDGITWTGWALPHGTPLYASPAAPTQAAVLPVALTDDEIDDLLQAIHCEAEKYGKYDFGLPESSTAPLMVEAVRYWFSRLQRAAKPPQPADQQEPQP